MGIWTSGGPLDVGHQFEVRGEIQCSHVHVGAVHVALGVGNQPNLGTLSCTQPCSKLARI
jgi:hypothetical protein